MQRKDSATVKRTLDLSKPPVLSAQQRARLAAVAAMPDDQIDYSDAPEVDTGWLKATLKLPRAKQQVTMRLDADVLEFFKRPGTKYQTQINAVLRSYVDAHKRQEQT
ncbi:MAG: BrnA antitoxin family protein [Pseudomonadota bacterium]|jgi:uncharacterized protein (DUF4415 family)